MIRRRNFLKILFVFLPSVFLCTECSKDHLLDCVKSTGRIITLNRAGAKITSIELRQNVNLVVRTGAGRYIKVTAGEHLQDGIITEISGNKLFIRNENKCNWVRSFDQTNSVEVGLDTLKQIDDYGSGDIQTSDTVFADDFAFNSWNASGTITLLLHAGTTHLNNHIGRTDIHASGISGVSYVMINDTGQLDAYELYSGYTFLRNESTGDCKVRAEKEIDAEIRYVGNVYYRGSPPVVNSNISGTGKLIKAD